MSLIDLIFPKQCLQCGKNGTYICRNCVKRVRLAKQVCVECQRQAIDGVTHTGCRTSLGLDGTLAGFEYKWVIKRGIKSIKYRFVKDIAQELSDLLIDNIKNNINALPKDPVLVPVALHKKRLNWRGFNQAEEMGRIVARKMRWRFASDLLIRTKYTIPQVELKGDERKGNVQGIFVLNQKYRQLITKDQAFIIFDDVITTGATVREACKVIKRKNKKLMIWGFSVAR